MRHITIIDGHPDPSDVRLTHALADRYAETARAAGSEVRRINVADLHFPLLRSSDDFVKGTPPLPIQEAQRDIQWADHVAFFYPMWDGDMPALLKGFIEQTFRPGFALEYTKPNRFPKKLLTGKSSRIVMTMGMPEFIYRSIFRAHSLKSFKQGILELCGFSPVRSTLLGAVDNASEKRANRWFDRVAAAAQIDGIERRERRLGGSRRLLAAGAVLAAGAYAAYFVNAWSRYGSRKGRNGQDPIMDRIMPDYEVSIRHHANVKAPAAVAMDSIRMQDFRRFSPLVRGIFRTRDVLMRAKHGEPSLPDGLIEQLKSFGWSILAEVQGREIVLGTVTQPWQANPVFTPLRPEEFARFNEPGYAKIAMTLCVDPVSPEVSEVRTETRVATTDEVSRGRFRRYWALLSPGIDIVRMLLLRQIKADAEMRWHKNGEFAPTPAEETSSMSP